MSQQEIAERLVISRKTASNQVEHIYAKIGVSNRAMASLFATRHGLPLAASQTLGVRLMRLGTDRRELRQSGSIGLPGICGDPAN
jgi:hypothetical protein